MLILGLFLTTTGILGILYPFFIYPITLLVFFYRTANKNRVDWQNNIDTKTIRAAVVFCAYNEQVSLPRKIDNIRHLKKIYPHVRFLAYSDGSTDHTNKLLKAAADVVDTVISAERHGKSVGMNTLLNRVEEDIVILTDANVTFENDTIRNIVRPFEDSNIGVVSGSIIYESSKSSSASINRLYWQLEQKTKGVESQIDTAIGADGSIFAIRRRLFRPVPHDIIDDFFTSLSIICDGYRCIQRDDTRVYEAQVKATRDEFQRKIRITCRAFNCHRLLWPRLRNLSSLRLYMYASHKMVRWFSGLFVGFFGLGIAIILLELLGIVLALLVILGVICVVLGVPMVRRISLALGAALVAPTIGVMRSIQGVRHATWQPAASGR